MKRIFCYTILVAFALVSCTAAVEPIPASTLAPSGAPAETPAPTFPPTQTPQPTPTEADYLVHPLVLKDESELVDSRINSLVSGVVGDPASDWVDWVARLKHDGFTRTRFTLNFSDGVNLDLAYTFIEEELPGDYVDLFRQMKDLGIKSRYSLSFWDMVYRQNGGSISQNRLSVEEERARYLAYVKMVATRLKGLVDSYELWNEPDANYKFYQRIEPED